VYENEKWVIYDKKIDVPEGANPTAWRDQEDFLENVARPNIEKHRKGDATIEITDETGKPVQSGTYQVRLTNHAFNFGVSLPPFADLSQYWTPEWVSPPVTPKQLERAKEVFNYSVMPFSSKWQFIEPVEGQRNYEELDKYVDWCTKNNIRMEFHYLSGFSPSWVRRKSSAEQVRAWKRHCIETVDRYADRIKVWQIVNDSYLIEYAADIFKEIRKKHPDLKLGISHCAKFYPGGEFNFERGNYTGIADVEQLKAEGVTIDYFGAHGHAPHGTWPSAKSMYALIDAFASYGIKVRITEATLDLGLRMTGPIREGLWTPELAADYWEQYYTVAFSHPEVDAINYWDLSASTIRAGRGDSGPIRVPGGTGGAGLLDPSNHDEPRPAFYRLKHLITEVWTTKLDGQLPSDAKVPFRGFYGEYEVVVRQPSGKVLRGTFEVKKGADNKLKVQVRPETTASLVTGG
jgi:GH35 family endo-1,4-beta-xylanase